MKRKPDGWCVWHPDFGNRAFIPSGQPAELHTILIGQQIEMTGEKFGWQIKPAYIVDASPDSKEVVVPKGWLEELRLFLCEMQARNGAHRTEGTQRMDLMLYKVIDKVNQMLNETKMDDNKEES